MVMLLVRSIAAESQKEECERACNASILCPIGALVFLFVVMKSTAPLRDCFHPTSLAFVSFLHHPCRDQKTAKVLISESKSNLGDCCSIPSLPWLDAACHDERT